MDDWLRCWSCGGRIEARLIRRDGMLRARENRDGGPFYNYDCPQCGAENTCERTCRGRFFASPPDRVTILDYLLEKIWPGAPESFLRMISWYRENEEKRRYFFEADGDYRYSGLRARLFRAQPEPGRTEEPPPREPPPRRPPPRRPPPRPTIASPYEILGVAPGASAEEIKRAFHRLIKRAHPDKMRHLGPDVEARATQRFKELLEAYEKIREGRAGKS
ncbi:MAG: J domain-containing protein [Planctomycetes bacterium]|nr:J domain-containing protein [Planctomycetota bacterium]